MDNRKLISEIARIQEMMGIQIITEGSLFTKFEKYIRPVIEKLVKSGEKVADRELEQAFINSLDDAIVDTSNIYSKKLKRKGILTLQDLANLGSKGFTEEEIEGITNLLLTKAIRQIEQNFPGALQKKIDDTFIESKGYQGIMNLIKKLDNRWVDGIIPQEAEKYAQNSLTRLKNSRNNYLKMGELSPELRETTIKQLDDTINALEQKLNGTFTKAAGETISVTGEQVSKLVDDLSKSFESIEQLYKPDLKVIESLAKKEGWPKEEINKLIKLMAKEAPKTEEEFVQKAGKYIADNKDRIAEQLRKEGLEKEARELTKMTAGDIIAKFGRIHTKIWNHSYAGKGALIIIYGYLIGKLIGKTIGFGPLIDKVDERLTPFFQEFVEGPNKTPADKQNQTQTPPQDQNQTQDYPENNKANFAEALKIKYGDTLGLDDLPYMTQNPSNKLEWTYEDPRPGVKVIGIFDPSTKEFKLK